MGNSWVDYANLGMNAANAAMNAEQIRSLSEANSQLAQLSQIEADRERRRQIENKLRQFVFDQEIKLKNLVEASGATPAAKWFGATLIKRELDSVPVSASSFQEFVDKDRVAAFQRRLIQTIQENQRQLTASQLSELQWAIRILNERQALSEYIAAVQAQDYLDQTQAEWDKKSKISISRGNTWGCAVPFFIAAVGIPAGFVIKNETGMMVAAVAAITPFVIVIAWVFLNQPLFDALAKLKEQRDAATNKLPSAQRLQVLRKLFGANVTSAGLLQEQQRREQSLAAIVRRI